MPQVERWEIQLCACFVAVALGSDFTSWRLFPKLLRQRWPALPSRTKLLIVLRIATAPASAYCLGASLKVLSYSDAAILLEQDGVQSSARSTWLLAAAMYTYDLARTFPPRSQDVVHHVGWMGLTFVLYWSTMSTNPGITTLMIRNVAACSFFSLGLSGTVQLALLLMERLGPWTRPPLRMARCFRGLVWTLVLSRPMSRGVYIVTYEALWRITATPADFAVMAVLTIAFLGLFGASDLEVRTSRAGKMIVLTTYWVVVVAIAIVLLARATGMPWRSRDAAVVQTPSLADW
ncbi:uncharacterized protein B0I36DRAFT_368881 [Microdochium trichocladiopsis]|uniref:Uncharacterized protein n=1 Tax=Microdochium trichocladiopsis TaxID=1682393 RepID=A0A9P8XUT2_9PEZI|nr:uncharacterized protein B0I36DRAFT_368881 [Microdochium trichocladiopsis]KAH7016334.1 hypothetical protein B0I36DRAFT_368881 [Microdochium trichocladiopsis]